MFLTVMMLPNDSVQISKVEYNQKPTSCRITDIKIDLNSFPPNYHQMMMQKRRMTVPQSQAKQLEQNINQLKRENDFLMHQFNQERQRADSVASD